ncbi:MULTISPECIES: ATP-dependent helicase [Peptoniphilus]|jgi:putative ATP-dependent DNA helicase pcrA|uniref:ATP-dependent helicase n=1 Tax=Peptoniphilus TaxID=162289 RepID=UPI0025863850|nr:MULTISPECIES: UvrD-helicase domain-containing protein [Peptoniphilus]MDU1043811.1 UvrD-helicase domain-containing protein [Peptoniphilus rhinitidis]MDU7302693.1 UvrD-helicase domain-containing protein [Peptoniphilus lacydonensis]
MDINTLNDKQREALLATEGPLLILAGAGSGKTKVVTSKIAYLIEELKVPSWKILAITFTNKAAKEMKDRVANLIDRDISSMWIGTFHSICVRILRKNIESIGYSSNFTIYDRDDQITVVKEAIAELNLDRDIYKPRAIINDISNIKSDGLTPIEYLDLNKDNFYKENLGKIYDIYEKKLRSNNALDFDDLLIKTVNILKSEDYTRNFYRDKFQYIFVDEYQDTNKIQYEFVKLIAGENPNLTVVGDNDQSIYKWRGADINNILNFHKDFPGAKIVKLEQNYRSTQKILDVANKVIENNDSRIDKNLWTARDEGKNVLYKEFPHSNEEEYGVINKIIGLNYKGEEFKNMAILYRTNAQSRGFEEVLIRERIPYKIVGGLKFYDRMEVKDVLAYLRVINNPDDNVSLARIINRPKRGIGDTSLADMLDYADKNNLSLYDVVTNIDKFDDLNLRARKNIKEFGSILKILKDRSKEFSIGKLFEDVLYESGYALDLKNQNTIESKTRLENIEELHSNIMEYDREGVELSEYLNTLSLLSDVDKTSEDSGVNLMTMHAAKGLEFGTVFLVGLEEGLFPTSRSLESEEEVEEERRLCYVGVTRACDNLFISSSRTRSMYGKLTPARRSRFIDEMGDTIEIIEDKNRELLEVRDYNEKNNYYKRPAKFIGIDKKENVSKKNSVDKNINVGDTVKHKIFGKGMVVQKKEKNGDYEVVISFEKKGLKRLMLSVAPIKLVD